MQPLFLSCVLCVPVCVCVCLCTFIQFTAASLLSYACILNCIRHCTSSTWQVWDVSRGACLQVLRGHTSTLRSVVLLENDFVISGSRDRTVRSRALLVCLCVCNCVCVNVCTCACACVYLLFPLQLHTIHTRTCPLCCCVQVRVWRHDTGECLHVLEGHTDSIR